MGWAMSEPDPIGAILVRAADLFEVHRLLQEISEQNRAVLADLRHERSSVEERHVEHDRRLSRLERRFRWMFAAIVVAAAVGFAAGWKWRGEVAPPPQIIYAPMPPT